MNIKICSRTYGEELFGHFKEFVNLPYDIIPIKNLGSKAYVEKILSIDADMVINMDEDCFVSNNNEVELLIEYMLDNNYDYCGVPDGGLYDIRAGSPIVMNPFFNIFNLRKIRPVFLKEKSSIVNGPKKILNCMDKHLLNKIPYPLSNSKFKNISKGRFNSKAEPYYPIFYWLAETFNPLYLNGRTGVDGWTSIVDSHRKKEICHHTWFARHYRQGISHRGKDQRERIHKVIEKLRSDRQ